MSTTELDVTDLSLLSALSENGRASASDLAAIVGLTRQTVTERLNRLRSERVIDRFTIGVVPEKIGLAVRAYIAITMLPTCSSDEERKVIELLEANPYVQECYRVTGDDYFQIRVVAPGIEQLKDLVLLLRGTHVVQNTRTLLALEVCFEKSSLRLPAYHH